MKKNSKIIAYVSKETGLVFYINKRGKFQRENGMLEYTFEELADFCTPTPITEDDLELEPNRLKTKTEELVEAILMIGARRGLGVTNLSYDAIHALIRQHIKSLSKRVDDLILTKIQESNPNRSKLDLKKMSEQIDEMLAKETPESLNKWLTEQRAKFKDDSTNKQESGLTIADYEESFESHRKLVKELDIIINGEEGCAEQASLCDIVSQLKGKEIIIK